VESSANVYQRFVEFEERSAMIYMELASHFSGNSPLSSFWLEMGIQEKEHAGLLQFCLKEKLFASGLPDDAAIKTLNDSFAGLEKRAADPKLDVKAAFALALEMESSELNAIYCNLTSTLHNSLYLLRRKIAASLPNHIDELIASARKFGVPDEALRELTDVKKKCSGAWVAPE
jgi:hypothetical protein